MLKELMETNGFYLQQTGGNCTAYIKEFKIPQLETLITVQDDAQAPKQVGDAITVKFRYGEDYLDVITLNFDSVAIWFIFVDFIKLF